MRVLSLFGALCVATVLLGQSRTVDSDWQEFAHPDGRSMLEAEQWVIQQAKVMAMEAVFGSRVESESVHVVSDFNGRVDDAFSELNVMQVKGEWMETTSLEGPEKVLRDGELWWRVRIKGRARPLDETGVDLELVACRDVLVLEAVTGLEHGERLRARFSSPVDGHVMFFYSEQGLVYALSDSNTELAEAVKGQRVYSLFSPESEWLEAEAEAQDLHRLSRFAWGFQVTNSGDLDLQGMLIGVFALNPFAPPRMDWSEEERIWSMGEQDFERWIRQGSGRQDVFEVERAPIRIKARKRY